jgi:glycolate oxidase iron-sulfur subunit
MQTKLSAEFQGTALGAEAEAELRKCVHCGFCLATCPTYQLLGDELDSPRGRIYLVKQVLEGQPATQLTQQHLDRCLTCRNCETTCPSGVAYGRLVDIGRRVVEARVARPRGRAAVRWLLREGLTSRWFAPALGLGQWLRGALPAALQAKVPARTHRAALRAWPATPHARRVLLLAGCVQPALLPNVNPATARVLDAAGIQAVVEPRAGCCGAIRDHLADHSGAQADARRNIDAWWPAISGSDGGAPVEAIVSNASGCGAMLKDYAHLLAQDPAYAVKAQRVGALARDIAEVVAQDLPALQEKLRTRAAQAAPRPVVALHLPCTLQHGQKLPGILQQILPALDFDVATTRQESHLCCGSAGTYSVLEPELAQHLRDRKLAHLRELERPTIVSANVGCIQHLQSGTHLLVRHWIEVLDDQLLA